MVIEQRIERVARVAEFRYDQWIGSDLGHGDALLGREGMLWRRDHDQFVAMNHLRFEPVVIHGQ